MFDGRFVINPPIFVPNLSARNVAVAIQIPATKNDMITLDKNIESMIIIYKKNVTPSERSDEESKIFQKGDFSLDTLGFVL